MSDLQSNNIISRIGNWFKKANDDLNGARNTSNDHDGASNGGTQLVDGNQTSFLRPWARRDAAINNLQDGFHTLTDLMSSVRDNLERSSLRQDELLQYLSHLPEALQSLPESNRIHNEALKAIHQQLSAQNAQQTRLADILEKLNTKGLENGEVLDEVRDRVEAMRTTDEAIATNLNNFGDAMQSITRNGATSTQVLEQMRDNLNSRDGQLERILNKQSSRFTTMLAVAIFLSIAALCAVGVIGWMMMEKLK